MKTTYRAMQIASPGVLELVERTIPEPSADEVLIRVEACGVCGADLSDSERMQLGGGLSRVPGHEIIGHIARAGVGVPDRWVAGQRVGVGRLGGYCQNCLPCREGLFHLCQNQLTPGLSCDGGYAEYLCIRHTALVAIPDELSSVAAAPILCAGTATFNALRRSGAGPGDRIAILGVGGLGHMAIQYARRMGFEVIAIGRGEKKTASALALGAHTWIDADRKDVVQALRDLGGASRIVATVPDSAVVSGLIPALAPRGEVILLGVDRLPLQVMPGFIVGGERAIRGSFVSTPAETERALRFSALFNVAPITEELPLERANDALRRLREGKARYRIVLTMNKDG